MPSKTRQPQSGPIGERVKALEVRQDVADERADALAKAVDGLTDRVSAVGDKLNKLLLTLRSYAAAGLWMAATALLLSEGERAIKIVAAGLKFAAHTLSKL